VAAREALRRAERGRRFLRDALHDVFRESDLSPRDRALATQLATGVMRHRRTLRLLLAHVRAAAGRVSDIQAPLRTILELGAFQLLFLDRVPAYAAVNEAVEAARRTASAVPPKGIGRRTNRTAAFVNAMLRALARRIAGRDAEGLPAPDAVPHPEGGVVRMREPVFPDPRENRAAFLGAAYSYPDWLVARWIKNFGDDAERICRFGNRRPRTFARVSPMPRGLPEAMRRLEAEEPRVRPGPRPGSLDVSALSASRLETLLAEGRLTVQDPSAMAAVEALAPVPEEAVLDLCAAPGTKTTQIVEAMGDRGRVVACDRSEEKLRPLRRIIAARKIQSVTIGLARDLGRVAPETGFDAALVDVPCSNTGVLARRVEARWRLRPADFHEWPRRQRRLLDQAARYVRPGGRLVYSTCSLEAEENEGVVQAFLRGRKGWQLRRCDLILPAADHDGAFWALLDRELGGPR